jgi:hypothetical protein
MFNLRFLCRLNFHRWVLVGCRGANLYYQCSRCASRRWEAIRGLVGLVDEEWISGEVIELENSWKLK